MSDTLVQIIFPKCVPILSKVEGTLNVRRVSPLFTSLNRKRGVNLHAVLSNDFIGTILTVSFICIP